jgi:Na+/H+ antiporter NhaD/arsenite permease-like protein
VLFPFHIPIFFPRILHNALLDTLCGLRIIPPRRTYSEDIIIPLQPEHTSEDTTGEDDLQAEKAELPGAFKKFQDRFNKVFVTYRFPMNFVTAPLIADLFLLAIVAIGRQEVHDGTVGANNISPLDIMIFFITLAYIAISIDASGLIRYLAFRVLKKAGKVGHRLFFYLYAFFFGLGTFIGNDPIILSGTAFLAYMTRVSKNIVHPRAWIHSQFAIANIASAILVSSNPTNLVLAGAFQVKFIEYTANMIVPVVVTAIVLFPFLLYVVFADESLIPVKIEIRELDAAAAARKPVNPNIPNARGNAQFEEENEAESSEQGKLMPLEEIMNPFVDKKGAAFGAVIMAATLATVLALNAASQSSGEHPVFWVTLPAATVMFCWDVWFGWFHRHETRKIARDGRQQIEEARLERARKAQEEARLAAIEQAKRDSLAAHQPDIAVTDTEQLDEKSAITDDNENGIADDDQTLAGTTRQNSDILALGATTPKISYENSPISAMSTLKENPLSPFPSEGLFSPTQPPPHTSSASPDLEKRSRVSFDRDFPPTADDRPEPTTLVSLFRDRYVWLQETFPTVMAVLAHLPFALIPFAFSMFVLVQALVTKGWVPVFAHGWDHWVNRTGTVGAVGGMGFLSVILCNVSLFLFAITLSPV